MSYGHIHAPHDASIVAFQEQSSKPKGKGSWRNGPAGPKQRYWIEKCLADKQVGISLRDQAVAALADDTLTKGDASDLLDQLFACPKKGADLLVGQGVYRSMGAPGTVAEGTEVISIVRPNQKYVENPAQKGANLYSMSLVPAPGTNGQVRYELVFDPEARGKLHNDMKVTTEAEIADVLAKCPSRVAKTIRDLI